MFRVIFMGDRDHTPLKRYILITPAKNEEKYLPGLIKSISEQTIEPSLWAIVDDGSTDTTPKILENAKNVYEWVQIIRLEESKRDWGLHLSSVCVTGFDFAIGYCKDHGMDYDYIGLVDADILLEEQYFEKLINEFENDALLGIASGDGANIVNGQIIPTTAWRLWRRDSPSGGARLWRVQCFRETDGYILTGSPDTISNIKAKLKGWETKVFTEIRFVSPRAHTSAAGLWGGYRERGKNDYFIYYPFVYVLLRGMRSLSENPHYIGFAYLYGYFSNFILGRERIDDDEIRHYFKYVRAQEINEHYVNLLKEKIRIKRDIIGR